MSSRLEPIERPPSLLLRLGYMYSRRVFGKVMAPLKVIYARSPSVMRASVQLGQAAEKKLSLEASLRLLVQAQASAVNGCGFCLDMKKAMAVQEHLGLDKFDALANYRESPLFDERERAALDYASEVTRNRRVSDDLFERLRKHFSEREIVEITFANAVENFYNCMAVPLGLESDGLCSIAQGRSPAPTA